jgi:hypothetical protein
MPVNLLSSGGGTTTLTNAASASNFTVTIPASTGTILTTTSPKAGNVIQVVSATTTSVAATSSTSFQASNITVSITPTSASNKIFVSVSTNGYAGVNDVLSYTIYRNATELSGVTGGFTSHWISGGRGVIPCSMQYLDSPSTTSSTTYTVYFKSNIGGSVNTPDGGDARAVITVMEIAA